MNEIIERVVTYLPYLDSGVEKSLTKNVVSVTGLDTNSNPHITLAGNSVTLFNSKPIITINGYSTTINGDYNVHTATYDSINNVTIVYLLGLVIESSTDAGLVVLTLKSATVEATRVIQKLALTWQRFFIDYGTFTETEVTELHGFNTPSDIIANMVCASMVIYKSIANTEGSHDNHSLHNTFSSAQVKTFLSSTKVDVLESKFSQVSTTGGSGSGGENSVDSMGLTSIRAYNQFIKTANILLQKYGTFFQKDKNSSNLLYLNSNMSIEEYDAITSIQPKMLSAKDNILITGLGNNNKYPLNTWDYIHTELTKTPYYEPTN